MSVNRYGRNPAMLNFENPFEMELQRCQDKINECEVCLAKEKEQKNLLVGQIADFYTEKLQGAYYKCEETGRIGQIDKVYFKSGKFYVHAYYLDVTANSKIRKMYSNIEFDEMEGITLLTGEEYREEFFCYVNPRLKATET